MNRNKAITIGLVGLLYGLVYLATQRLGLPLHHDEKHYLRTVGLFSHDWLPSLALLGTYPELNTPLPFIVGGWLHRLFGADIYPLRLFMFTASYLVISLFCLANRGTARRFWLAALGLGLFPYYLFCSVLFYTDMLAMLLLTVGLLAYQRTWHVAAAASFVLAICTRQFMVVFPAAILVYEFVTHYLPYAQASSWRKAFGRFGYAGFYVAAVASLGGWVLFWHGLAPAAEMARQQYGVHTSRIDVGFSLYAMACLGLYGALVEAVLFNRWADYVAYARGHRASLLTMAGLLALLTWLCPAQQHINSFAIVPHMGPLDRALQEADIPFWGRQAVFWALGCVFLCRLRLEGFTLTTVCLVLNVLLMSKTQIAWDKYLMPALLVFWLLKLTSNHPISYPLRRRLWHRLQVRYARRRRLRLRRPAPSAA